MKKPQHVSLILLLYGLLLILPSLKAQNSSPATSQNILLQAAIPPYIEHVVIRGHSKTVTEPGEFILGENQEDETRPPANLLEIIQSIIDGFGRELMSVFGISQDTGYAALDNMIVGWSLPDFLVPVTKEEDFTLIFTQDGMRKDTEEGTVILRLSPEGGRLQLLFRTSESNGYRGIMVPTQSVTGGSHIATTNQIAPNGPDREILGNTSYKYSYNAESTMLSETTSGGFKKVSQGWAWTAPEVPGTNLITLFYTNLSLGGYDVGGGPEAGLAGVMLRYPDAGIPLEARDVSEYFLEWGTLGGTVLLPVDLIETLNQYLYKETTTHVVTSISYELPYEDPLFLQGTPPNYEELIPTQPQAGNSPDIPGNPQTPPPDLGITGVQSNAPPPNNQVAGDGSGCDCSCAAYAIYQEVIATRGNSPARNEAELAANEENARVVRCGISCMTTWIHCPK